MAKLRISGAAAAGVLLLLLTGCSVTVPVAVVTARGEVLTGSNRAPVFGAGTFEVGNARLQCTGQYDPAPGSQTVAIAARCSDGTAGVGQAVRDSALSGGGKIQMSDGTEARFVFGAAARALAP